MFKNFMKLIKNKEVNTNADLLKLKTILQKYQKDEQDINQEILDFLCGVVANKSSPKTDKNQILIIACHLISNISLNENHALYMIECGVIKSLTKLLMKNKNNSKLVWKCTSALWNLCRPSGIEAHIPDHLPNLVLTCLVQNSFFKKAVHTCLGALSNLALVKPLETAKIMKRENIQQMCEIVYNFKNIDAIIGHFGAMIANIAVVLDVAERFVDNHLIKVLLQLLTITTELDCAKHLVAAIHNLSDVKGFVSQLCQNSGVEVLREVEQRFNEEIRDLVAAVFELGSLPNTANTSLHASITCCDVDTMIDVLQKFGNIEEKDTEGRTSLDLALENKKYAAVQLLLGSGANLTSHTVEKMEIDQDVEMETCVSEGKAIRVHTMQRLQDIIFETNPVIHADICNVVSECIPGVDLMLELC